MFSKVIMISNYLRNIFLSVHMNAFDFKYLFVFEISVDSYENLENGLSSLSQMLSNSSEIHTHKKKTNKTKGREQMRWGNHMVINLFPFYAHAFLLWFLKAMWLYLDPTMSWKIEMMLSLQSLFFPYWRNDLQKEPKSYKTVNDPPFWTSHPQDSFGQGIQALIYLLRSEESGCGVES